MTDQFEDKPAPNLQRAACCAGCMFGEIDTYEPYMYCGLGFTQKDGCSIDFHHICDEYREARPTYERERAYKAEETRLLIEQEKRSFCIYQKKESGYGYGVFYSCISHLDKEWRDYQLDMYHPCKPSAPCFKAYEEGEQ